MFEKNILSWTRLV